MGIEGGGGGVGVRGCNWNKIAFQIKLENLNSVIN